MRAFSARSIGERKRESEESRRRAERERFHRRAAAGESDVSGRRERCIAFRLQTCSLSRLSPFQPKCACAVTGRKEQSAARREQFERVQWRGTRGEGKGEKTNRRAARGGRERAGGEERAREPSLSCCRSLAPLVTPSPGTRSEAGARETNQTRDDAPWSAPWRRM